jgi:galactose-1-phosphate uridylyltransferase
MGVWVYSWGVQEIGEEVGKVFHEVLKKMGVWKVVLNGII